jgi:SAM-dependent methyltransferase
MTGEEMQDIRFADLDWNLLRQKAMEDISRPGRSADDWDRKAPSFAQRNTGSLYTEKFLALLRPQPAWTVLDVGCGPGTLALPLANLVTRVTALDFSRKMLDILEERSRRDNITNITTRRLSWADEWEKHGIRMHDVAIASRSLAVKDLRSSLEQLNRFAKKAAVVTDRVGHGPFDPDAFTAVGRPIKTGPDYIYTINLLYQMGIRASVQFIHLESEIPCSTLDEAMEIYTWMFHDLTPTEKKRLKKYVLSITTTTKDGTMIVHRKHTPTWAFIRWQPE